MWNRPYLPKVRSRDVAASPAERTLIGLTPGSALRILSRDESDGALTALWDIPCGWRHETAFTLEGGAALFVLEGCLRQGAYAYGVGHYAYRAKGALHEPLESEEGARVLMMWDADPRLRPVGSIALDDQPSLLWVDGQAIDECPTPVQGPPAGIKVRILRRDLRSGGMTMIVSIPAGWEESRAEHHDCVEESFKLSGEIWLHENHRPHVLAAGDYFFRPPQIKHGPMRTLHGTSSLIRFSSTVVNHYGPIPTDAVT